MKKVFLLLIFFYGVVLAQPTQSVSGLNSTYTPIDSAVTWTGTKEYLTNNTYNTIIITVYSNVGGTLKVAQSREGTTFKSYTIFNYTAGDTVNNKFMIPITFNWVRVSYTNGVTNQSTFSLQTSYNKLVAFPIDGNGNLKQDSIENKLTNINSNLLLSLSYLHPYTLRGATQSTVTTEVDTVIFTGATIKVKWIVYAKDDSLEASIKGDFSDAQPIPTNTSFTFDNFSPLYFPKGYIRRWGTVGTVNYSQSWLAY